MQVLVSWSGVLHLKSAMSTRVWQVSFSLSHCPSCQLCALAAMVGWLWSSVLTGTSLKSGLVWIRTCPGSSLCLATTFCFKSLLTVFCCFKVFFLICNMQKAAQISTLAPLLGHPARGLVDEVGVEFDPFVLYCFLCTLPCVWVTTLGTLCIVQSLRGIDSANLVGTLP